MDMGEAMMERIMTAATSKRSCWTAPGTGTDSDTDLCRERCKETFRGPRGGILWRE